MGGAVYLFLRGCEAPGAGAFTERPERALIESLDRLFCGEREGAI
jgi:exodeoxyribonuclease V beta subunit